MADDLDLSRDLTAAVSAVGGVIEVFTAGSVAQTAVMAVANLTASPGTADARVAVARHRGALDVRAWIGVDSSSPVPQTARAAASAIRSRLGEIEPDTPAQVTVRVGYIQEQRPPGPRHQVMR